MRFFRIAKTNRSSILISGWKSKSDSCCTKSDLSQRLPNWNLSKFGSAVTRRDATSAFSVASRKRASVHVTPPIRISNPFYKSPPRSKLCVIIKKNTYVALELDLSGPINQFRSSDRIANCNIRSALWINWFVLMKRRSCLL